VAPQQRPDTLDRIEAGSTATAVGATVSHSRPAVNCPIAHARGEGPIPAPPHQQAAAPPSRPAADGDRPGATVTGRRVDPRPIAGPTGETTATPGGAAATRIVSQRATAPDDRPDTALSAGHPACRRDRTTGTCSRCPGVASTGTARPAMPCRCSRAGASHRRHRHTGLPAATAGRRLSRMAAAALRPAPEQGAIYPFRATARALAEQVDELDSPAYQHGFGWGRRHRVGQSWLGLYRWSVPVRKQSAPRTVSIVRRPNGVSVLRRGWPM
jgi:hypothetical protein